LGRENVQELILDRGLYKEQDAI